MYSPSHFHRRSVEIDSHIPKWLGLFASSSQVIYQLSFPSVTTGENFHFYVEQIFKKK